MAVAVASTSSPLKTPSVSTSTATDGPAVSAVSMTTLKRVVGAPGVDPHLGPVESDLGRSLAVARDALALGQDRLGLGEARKPAERPRQDLEHLVAQLVDVQMFHFWKRVTNGKHLWLRNNGSTLVSQLVDSTAVIVITFYVGGLGDVVDRTHPVAGQLVLLIATGYVFKVAMALFDTVPFYVGSSVLCRYLRLPPADSPHVSGRAAVEAGVG